MGKRMNLILLRGQVPTDRDYHEIKHNSLEQEDDIYSHIAYHMADKVEIVYWGRDRFVTYKEGVTVRWVDKLKHYKPTFEPTHIWARGGFPEYNVVLDKYPKVFKAYYGAGARFLPDRKDYNLILVDSEEQKIKAMQKFPKSNVELWFKPAPDNLIHDYDVPKIYDICYVANGSQAKIKGVKWIYRTIPKELSMLHLGTKSKYDPPKNVIRKRILRRDIFQEIKKCKVGIIPYDSIDSCPRAMVEMLACGLPVIALDTVRFWRDKYTDVQVVNKNDFWNKVKNAYPRENVALNYKNNLSIEKCAEYLKGIFNEPRIR